MRASTTLLLLLLATTAGATGHSKHGDSDPPNRHHDPLYNPYTTKAKAAAAASAQASVNVASKYQEAVASAMVDGGTCHGSGTLQFSRFAIGVAHPDEYCRLQDSAERDLRAAAAMTCPGSRDGKSGATVPDSCVIERERLYSEGKKSLELARIEARRQTGLLGKLWRVVGW